ncbi:DUF1127 domain-containing protein (plasmid) [Pseudorhodobacter turbinis]|uniref:DUF1127 domain-containing protein n=1 Tax=Pseudorhodobacter turbinis TaxID=2500533 RepID=A0A4P8EM44_9RHOB|nr:DUF1127 domain-containing protein [Pseudorhodobacter turbinis]QCO58099.1 DUF1127 domain-containing protein [Pseudorhodobacter turbinis]
MAVSSHTSGSAPRQITPALTAAFRLGSKLLAVLAGVGIKAYGLAGSLVKALQMSRMISTLSGMNDRQLAQIGISRAEIPQYAVSLMADD